MFLADAVAGYLEYLTADNGGLAGVREIDSFCASDPAGPSFDPAAVVFLRDVVRGSAFNAWFTAYVAGNKTAMRVAEERFRTPFLIAFNAWLATHPFTNPNAPKGPTYMPQYVQPELAQSNLFDARADNYYSLGEIAGSNADGYVRTTVYLASVLFLVGISGHFRVRGARRGLVTVGGVILTVSVVLLILAPRPPV